MQNVSLFLLENIHVLDSLNVYYMEEIDKIYDLEALKIKEQINYNTVVYDKNILRISL